MGAGTPNVFQPGVFVWFEKIQDILEEALPVPEWQPMKQLAILYPNWLSLVSGNKYVTSGYRRMCVPRNEAADELACRGYDLPNPSSSVLSHSEIHSFHRAKMSLNW
ncbi:hypothetical protein TNCV_2235301 [Trichonephila clavipes]|nr:hypothetical protein TNCV_2235301 [Trichonephila clavipes]